MTTVKNNAGRAFTGNRYGDLRDDGIGGYQIFTEKGWTPYPKGATEIISFAVSNGWEVISNGLPCRSNVDGDVIVAVRLRRSPGWRPGGQSSPGFEIRVPWICEHTAFRLGPIMVKPLRRGWREVKSLTALQIMIRDHAVPKSGADVQMTV